MLRDLAISDSTLRSPVKTDGWVGDGRGVAMVKRVRRVRTGRRVGAWIFFGRVGVRMIDGFMEFDVGCE